MLNGERTWVYTPQTQGIQYPGVIQTQSPGAVPGVVMQPPVAYQTQNDSSPSPAVYTSYPKTQSLVLGAIQITIALLAAILNVVGMAVSAFDYNVFHPTAYGLWASIFYLLAGALGVQAGKYPRRPYIVASTVLSTLASIIVWSHIGIAMGSTIQDNLPETLTGSPAYYQTLSLIISSLLFILGFIEMIVSTWAACLGCCATCCRSSPSHVTTKVVYIPTIAPPAMIYPPGQQQPGCPPQAGGGQPTAGPGHQPTAPQRSTPNQYHVPGFNPGSPAVNPAFVPDSYQSGHNPDNYTSLIPSGGGRGQHHGGADLATGDYITTSNVGAGEYITTDAAAAAARGSTGEYETIPDALGTGGDYEKPDGDYLAPSVGDPNHHQDVYLRTLVP